MLSQNLQHLHDTLDEIRRDGLALTPVALIGVCASLKAAAADVRQLEAHTVPLPARLGDDLPGNVLRVSDQLIARGTRALCDANRHGGGPGDAA